mgnify:CR=1 FL=1
MGKYCIHNEIVEKTRYIVNFAFVVVDKWILLEEDLWAISF